MNFDWGVFFFGMFSGGMIIFLLMMFVSQLSIKKHSDPDLPEGAEHRPAGPGWDGAVDRERRRHQPYIRITGIRFTEDDTRELEYLRSKHYWAKTDNMTSDDFLDSY